MRHGVPLFSDRSGAPYSHGFLGSLLTAALTFLYGSAVASLYTFHSYRSGLATALHAAGVSDALIQLICRWTEELTSTGALARKSTRAASAEQPQST